MTASLLALALGLGLLGLAVLGPVLLRQAAPALVRVPRLAVALVGGGVLVWLGTLLAIGPMLAWAASGPVLLPEEAAAVCRRCLAAANPFPGGAVPMPVPAILLLALPAALTLALVLGAARELVRRARSSRDASRRLLEDARRRTVGGRTVWLVDSAQPFALALPARRGGIVLSTAALAILDEEELSAVLAHEHGHLIERHHLIRNVAEAVAAHLRWVPLVRAAADALPHYLEIAADNRARRAAGTPALVSALLKLGERSTPALLADGSVEVLHAAGPERIRQLVSPNGGHAGALPALVVTAYLAALALIAAAVHLPYASAALTGCS